MRTRPQPSEEEEVVEEVVEVAARRGSEHESYEHKLENLDDYIQEADEAGFFEDLVEENRQKKQAVAEEKQAEPERAEESVESECTYVKNQKNQEVMLGIKDKLLMEANLRRKTEEEERLEREREEREREDWQRQLQESKRKEDGQMQLIKEESQQEQNHSDIEFENAFESEQKIQTESKPVEVRPETRGDVTQVVHQPVVSGHVKTGSIDSYDIRRYREVEHYTLSQSRLTESVKREESLRTSRLADSRQHYERKPSIGTRQVESNVSEGRPVTQSTEQPSYNAQRKTYEGTRDAYERYESVKQMEPVRVDRDFRRGKSIISVSNWASKGKAVKQGFQSVGRMDKTVESRAIRSPMNYSRGDKVSTLSSILKSNVQLNHTEKKSRLYNPDSISSTRKKEMSGVRTPRTGKKKIRLTDYRPKTIDKDPRRQGSQPREIPKATGFGSWTDRNVQNGERQPQMNGGHSTARARVQESSSQSRVVQRMEGVYRPPRNVRRIKI